jgi:hypothetical protein
MEDLDKFLNFLMENSSDKRISISKRMKYGYRHFYLIFRIDESSKKTGGFGYHHSLEIVFDNRNKCVEIISGVDDKHLVIEDESFVEKWSNIFEEFLKKDLDENIGSIIDITLSSCEDKNLHREYTLRKIFKEDELI